MRALCVQACHASTEMNPADAALEQQAAALRELEADIDADLEWMAAEKTRQRPIAATFVTFKCASFRLPATVAPVRFGKR